MFKVRDYCLVNKKNKVLKVLGIGSLLTIAVLNIDNLKIPNIKEYLTTLINDSSNQKNIDKLTHELNYVEYMENYLNNRLIIATGQKELYEVDFGLDLDVQKILWDKCRALELDFIKTLGLMYHESRFDPRAVGPTNDYGLFQVITTNHKWLAEVLNTNLDPFDPITNISWGTHMLYLAYEKGKEKGLQGEMLDYFAWSVYNRGLEGVKKEGLAFNYIDNVTVSIEYIEDMLNEQRINIINNEDNPKVMIKSKYNF